MIASKLRRRRNDGPPFTAEEAQRLSDALGDGITIIKPRLGRPSFQACDDNSTESQYAPTEAEARKKLAKRLAESSALKQMGAERIRERLAVLRSMVRT